MPFSRWYPISNYHYDPALQPTKPLQNIQAQNEQNRKIPKGRYDTTYRREYLNFTQSPPLIKPNEKLNNYTVLPPITPGGYDPQYDPQQSQQHNNAVDHLISQPPSHVSAANYDLKNLNIPLNLDDPAPPLPMHQMQQQKTYRDDNNLPREPIQLSDAEENNLMNDVMREMGNYSSEQLKQFYSELTSYDPNLTGTVHNMYVSLVAMRNKLPLNDSLLRFVMCKFVQPNTQDPGYVNYEQMVKYLAQSLGRLNNAPQPSPRVNMQTNRQQPQERFDPDEQAILRLLHENTKDWDKANLIDCDNLRRQFYELDYAKRYVLPQSQIEDVLYKNRIPIQRSLIYQILEKYCKASTGLYKWPTFVDFVERTNTLANGKYNFNEDSKDMYSSKEKYRATQLDSLRAKVTEEERLNEIDRQIYNLHNLKQETQQRIESRLGDFVQGESWFTRFMRLANAMYSHRVNAGIQFLLPKEEANSLINAYNTVYELKIPDSIIQQGLNKCTRKGNVLIDDLLKILAKKID